MVKIRKAKSWKFYLNRKWGDSVLLTVTEFAKSIGKTVFTVNAWIYRHGLPVIRIGKRVYIREEDYEEWIESHKVVPEQQEVITVKPPRKIISVVAGKMKRIY